MADDSAFVKLIAGFLSNIIKILERFLFFGELRDMDRKDAIIIILIIIIIILLAMDIFRAIGWIPSGSIPWP